MRLKYFRPPQQQPTGCKETVVSQRFGIQVSPEEVQDNVQKCELQTTEILRDWDCPLTETTERFRKTAVCTAKHLLIRCFNHTAKGPQERRTRGCVQVGQSMRSIRTKSSQHQDDCKTMKFNTRLYLPHIVEMLS